MNSGQSTTYRSIRPTTSNGRASLFPDPAEDPSIGQILSVSSELIARAVGLSCSAGMALMFSPTSQGTAVGVHLWDGSTRDKRYATSQDGFVKLLEAVCDLAEAKLAGGFTGTVKRPGNAS
jgi:hypothetical protein